MTKPTREELAEAFANGDLLSYDEDGNVVITKIY